jgi:hypothetical protein
MWVREVLMPLFLSPESIATYERLKSMDYKKYFALIEDYKDLRES